MGGISGNDARQAFRSVRGLPAQVWQVLGKVDGVLACAAADFQHLTAVMEMRTQNIEDWLAIFRAGGGVGFFYDCLGQ